MKKIISFIFAVLVLVPAMVQAEFTVTQQPSTTGYVPTGIDQRVLNQLAKQDKAHKKVIKDIKNLAEKSVKERNEAFMAVAESNVQKAEADEHVAGALKSFGKQISSAGKTVNDYIGKEAKSLGNQNTSNAQLICGFVIFGIFIVIGCFILLKKTLNRVENKVDSIDVKIDDVPDLTAAAVKTLDPIIITLEDVVGRRITYNPAIVDGMYLSIYVPKTVTLTPTDPAQIVRAQMSDKGKLRRSTREVMTEYYNGAFNGADFHSVEQKRLILHLISTGEIVVA